ncbi:MAG TPA: 4-(cytidine 5'-diphospho)-2-C-methyl-D-erythritol kinase [Pseudolabrys sp.]
MLTEIAPAKINLTLRVLGRRQSGDNVGYHELESLVAFADLADRLVLEPGETLALDVTGPFATASGNVSDNLVLKAVNALRERAGGVKAGCFRLEKNIPVAAGVGGGSADAAAALRLLARVNDILLDDERLVDAARAVGADVPVCLASKARIMRGVGEQLSPPIHLPKLPAVLINPRIAVATRDVFGKLVIPHRGAPLREPPLSFAETVEFLRGHGNDLTDAAVACAPVVAGVLTELQALPNQLLVRMSGSGATCFALFSSLAEASAAAQSLQAGHPNWWVEAVELS